MGTIHRAFDRLAQREVAYKRLRVNVEASRARMTALFRREYDTLARLEHPEHRQRLRVRHRSRGPVLRDGAGQRQRPHQVRSAAVARRLPHHARGGLGARAGARPAARAPRRQPEQRAAHRRRHGQADRLRRADAVRQPTEVVGTPPFIPPECLGDEPLDQRVDLYALGALAYWMLTHRLAVAAYSLADAAGGVGDSNRATFARWSPRSRPRSTTWCSRCSPTIARAAYHGGRGRSSASTTSPSSRPSATSSAWRSAT